MIATMTTTPSADLYILLFPLVMLMGFDICNAHSLSLRKGQTSNLKMSYKIPRPVKGEVLAPRVIEMMLVLHHDLYRYHRDDTTDYVTYITSQAADLWNDVTNLGVNITIRITKTILIKNSKDSLSIEADSTKLLKHFCMDWQNKNNNRYSNNYDALILITREDLHLGNDYNATGLAYLLGACDEGYQCAVVEDTSPMGTAITLAHELGHLLGVYHDGQFNACPDRKHLMSGYTVSGVHSLRWSTCSTQSLLEFLRLPRSRCLQNNTSTRSYELITQTYPGQYYDKDHQCRIALGSKARACPLVRKEFICQHLKCIRPDDNKCVSTNRPALDGTQCAIDKWCHRGYCIEKSRDPLRHQGKLVAIETTTPMMGDTPSMRSTAAYTSLPHLRQRPKDNL